MGNTQDNVKELIDDHYGTGTFNAIKKNCKKEEGSPDYLYTIILTFKNFIDIIRKNNYKENEDKLYWKKLEKSLKEDNW